MNVQVWCVRCSRKTKLHHHIVKLTLRYILLPPECYTPLASVSSSNKDLCCVKIAHLCWQLVLKGSGLLQETAVLRPGKSDVTHEGPVPPRFSNWGCWGQVSKHMKPVPMTGRCLTSSAASVASSNHSTSHSLPALSVISSVCRVAACKSHSCVTLVTATVGGAVHDIPEAWLRQHAGGVAYGVRTQMALY